MPRHSSPAEPESAEASGPRAASRADFVYASLKKDLFDLRLLPGDWVSEANIAECFHVSRTPAREALQRLQNDGLMQGYVRGGWEVVPIDFKRFDDLYEMREMIETFAIRRLCSEGPPHSAQTTAVLDELLGVWDIPRRERLTDGLQVASHDEQFHQALVDAIGNEEMSAAMKRVTDRIHVVRRLDLSFKSCLDDTYIEHRRILDAVRTGNVEKAVAAVAKHIRGSHREVRELTVYRIQGARAQPDKDRPGYLAPGIRRTV